MARAPFQSLIIPFIIEDDNQKFAVFKRTDRDIWQFISGGGEDDETPIEAAKRECFEEADIPLDRVLYKLDTINTIPAEIFGEKYTKNWGENCFVIKEYSFAVKLKKDIIKISDEHSEFKWVEYDEAIELLKYDSNKTALTELRARIRKNCFINAE